MADYSCDFCKDEETCPYSYESVGCVVDDIKAARSIVSHDRFDGFYKFISDMEEETGENRFCVLKEMLKDCKRTADRTIPQTDCK